MENQKTSAKSIMLNYGAILGIISILISVMNYSFGNMYKPHWLISVIGILALCVIIILGIKKFKQSNNDFLKLGQALKIGLGIALIGAIISLIYTFIFTSFIEPDFVVNTIEFEKQKMIEMGQTDDQIDMAIGMMENYMMFMVAAGILIMNLFLGFIISLIGGLIMKKTDEEITSI